MPRTVEDIYADIHRATFIEPVRAEPGTAAFLRIYAERDERLSKLWAELAVEAAIDLDTPEWAVTAARTLAGKFAGSAINGRREPAVHGPLNGP